MLRLVVLAVLLYAGTASAAPPPSGGATPSSAQSSPVPAAMARESPASEKQKAIEADTEKLVQMAADLKVSVDKSTKNQLSLDVIRKAEAVEKLAKSLKERIREAR